MKFFFSIISLMLYGSISAQDFAQLNYYAAENATLSTPNKGEDRIVFIGNSITEQWKKKDSIFFTNKNYINRGISGQTSSQMLIRFRQDVISLKPKVVIIAAGINDIAENTGPITLENILGNIISMAELARSNNIKVILTSVLPAKQFSWRRNIDPAPKIEALNQMIREYATRCKIIYVDYYSPMVTADKGMNPAFSNDGVHPILAGYKIMEPLVKRAIARALLKQ
jgi:lysophospholipase L1-like esterase